MVTNINEEASPIARLIGQDGKQTVGWVYAWETAELSILWISKDDVVSFVDPPLCPDRFAKAMVSTPESVMAFLGALQNLSS